MVGQLNAVVMVVAAVAGAKGNQGILAAIQVNIAVIIALVPLGQNHAVGGVAAVFPFQYPRLVIFQNNGLIQMVLTAGKYAPGNGA